MLWLTPLLDCTCWYETVVGTCIVEGDGEEVTSTVVRATDPLARVTEACVVLTTGGGVVTVTIVEVLGGMGVDVVVVFDVVEVVVVITSSQVEKSV